MCYNDCTKFEKEKKTMLVILAVALLIFVFWVVYGRGALIVYKYQKDDGVELPEGMSKDDFSDVLKKEMSYPDLKTVYFDELGNVCLECMYDTYALEIIDGKAYINDPLYQDPETLKCSNKAVTFLSIIGYWRIRLRRKNQKRIEEIECIRSYIVKMLNHDAPINAHRQYKNFKNARKYSLIVSIIGVILAIALFGSAFSNDTQNEKIYGIKHAYLEAYSSDVTIGDAFDAFFSNSTWETYSEGDTDYVKFAGECTFYGKPALMVVIFEYMENDWFKVSDIQLNGESLSSFDESSVLDKIFKSYDE